MEELLIIKQEDAEKGGAGTAEENDLPTEAGVDLSPTKNDKKEKKVKKTK